MELIKFNSKIIDLKEIKDEWVFLNDNSSRNFLKYINTSTKETYSDYKRLRHLPRSAYADLHISEFSTKYTNNFTLKKFILYKNINDFENNLGELFTGVCYAYDSTSFFEKMLDEGNVDEEEIFKKFKLNNCGELYVIKVKNGVPYEISYYRCKEFWLNNKRKNFVYLKDKTSFSILDDSDYNQTFSLINKYVEYDLIDIYSKDNKNLIKHYKTLEKNYNVVIDKWGEKYNHNHNHKNYKSELHGLYREWKAIWSEDSSILGYYLSNEINYKNGKKHGYSRKWEAFFEGYSCYGRSKCQIHKYELDWKEYYNPPKLVFEGNFLKMQELENILIGIIKVFTVFTIITEGIKKIN